LDSAIGLFCSGGTNINFWNLHGDNIQGSLVSVRSSTSNFRGGLVNNCELGVSYQNVYGSVGDSNDLAGTWSSTFSNITDVAVDISRGSVCYVRKSTFTNNRVHIRQSRISRIRTQSNTFNAFTDFAIQQETALCIWNDDLANLDVFSGSTFNKSSISTVAGGYTSRFSNSGNIFPHRAYFGTPINFTGTTKAEPSTTSLTPFRMPGFWLMSPSAVGIVEYEILIPVPETVTLQIAGESTTSYLAEIDLVAHSSGSSRRLIRFEFTGPLSSSQGRYVVQSLTQNTATNQGIFGATVNLNVTQIVENSVNEKRFRFYITRSVGTGNLQILRMNSWVRY
jgi:hypothetical protein